MTVSKKSDRLEILISEYQACRDDERNFTALSAALLGVAATMLGLLAAATTQTCTFNKDPNHCLPVPGYFVAGAPLLPLIVFAYAQTQAVISVVRNYYIRGLEIEISTYATDPLKAFEEISSTPPMSFTGVVTALASLRRGRMGFRLLINFIFVAVIVVFGGLTIYIGAHLSLSYRIGMLLVYGPTAFLLITETLAATIGGRSLFKETLQRFSIYEPRSSEFRKSPDRTDRTLSSYLLIPRQEEFVKWLIAPSVFVAAAWVSDTLGNWPNFLLLWFIFEYLIYNARYQWNDTRGIDEDEIHAARSSRKRLPVGSGSSVRISVVLSLAVAACRILAAILIGLSVGLFIPVVILTAAVFATAILYEILRSASKPQKPGHAGPSRPNAKICAIWIVVGLGYALRAAVGFISARVPLDSPRMIIGLAFFAAFGVTFVLLTWVLEASSYCRADVGPDPHTGGSKTWFMVEGLSERPHIEDLLIYVDVNLKPAKQSSPGGPRKKPDAEDAGYCGDVAILKGSVNRRNPWNIAFVVGGALGASAGISLAAPSRHTVLLYVASTAISVLGALVVIRDDRPNRRNIEAVLIAAALGVLPAWGGAEFPVALVGAVPWIAIVSLYVMFRGSSYSDLKEFSPSVIFEKFRRLVYRSLGVILKAIVGERTWQRLISPHS